MDELTLLRRARTDIPERGDEEIARGREALLAAIDPLPPTPAARRRLRIVAWTGFSALGATALTVALVAGNVLGVPGVEVGGAEPAAASVLESAATAALRFSDPVVAAGQYLRVQTDAVFLAQGSPDTDDEMTGFLENEHNELFVPADRGDDWTWVQCMRTPTQTFGPRSEALAARLHGVDTDIWRTFPGGVTPSGPFSGYADGTSTTVDYAALPQDPTQLLQKIYEITDAALPEDAALAWIVDTLTRGTVPAETRALLYETAALIPGVTITEQQATLNGTTGVAVGRIEPERSERRDLIIDPATGQLIGQRIMHLTGIGDDIPPGTVRESTAVTTTVVDTAPADAALCGEHR